MDNEITVKNDNQQVTMVTEELIIEYMDAFGIGSNLTASEKKQFIMMAKMNNLNPFKKEIYCLKFKTGDGDKLSIITGYEVYLKRAEKIKTLDGIKCWTTGSIEKNDLQANIIIYRKDRSRPFEWSVKFKEYKKNNNFWREKPETMIKKVAIAQGFRMCFPIDFEGMPYTADEMPDHMTNQNIRQQTDKKQTFENNESKLFSSYPPLPIELEQKFEEDAETGWNQAGNDPVDTLRQYAIDDNIKKLEINNYAIGGFIIKAIEDIIEGNNSENQQAVLPYIENITTMDDVLYNILNIFFYTPCLKIKQNDIMAAISSENDEIMKPEIKKCMKILNSRP